MGYNKPITARIQHSTNKGMKVQDPLLDLGSPNKYKADASLTSGVENSKFVNVTDSVAEGMKSEKGDAPDAPAKQTAKQKANLPKEIVEAIAAKEGNKEPKGVGKNYKKGYYGK